MLESIRPEVLRILAGEQDAITWFYDSFAPRLVRRLGLRFGDVKGLEREDLVQDTFLYLLSRDRRALRRFLERAPEPTRDSLERFLWSTAGGIASNRRRSVLRHPSAPLDADHPVPGGEGPAVARDALERVGECLYRSGERVYLYFQLRYRDGLKPAEIAQATGWSPKTTYKLKQTLDEVLERCLKELGLEAT